MRGVLLMAREMSSEENVHSAPVGELPVKIWAHRGCCCRFPENTLAAFGAACRLRGLTGIELDIQLTKDGELVVIHDETVDRTTEGHGNVRDFTLGELKKLRIKAGTFLRLQRYAKDRIPLMREVLELVKPYCEADGLLINIELKNSRVRYEGMERKILDLVKAYGLEDFIVYSSFNPDSILLLKELDSSVKTGILNGSEKACLDFALSHAVDALHPAVRMLDVDDVRSNISLPVRVWGAPESFFPKKPSYEKQDLQLLKEKGVTDFITNVPEEYL